MMKKPVIYVVTILGLIVLAGLLAGTKSLQIKAMIAQGKQFQTPPETVTSAVVQNQSWESLVTSVGTIEAVQGVAVTAETPGKVINIAFEPGSRVAAGNLLVQQDISSETAQLRAAEASATLARINFERAKKLLPDKVISQSEFDNDEAQLTQALAEVDTIRAVIEKKTIRAPFSGRLGLRMINLGQVINEGQPIVSLQSLDPIFVNFLLPQQELPKIKAGLTVRVATDALPGKELTGKITAINPQVDEDTRNIRVQATLPNPDEQLRPGMYVNVAMVLPDTENVVAIPAPAVLYAPYSNSVFIIEKAEGNGQEDAGKVIRQQFVRLGEKRGDFVAVTSGLKGGETIVTTGVFKLRNGQSVVEDNTLAPQFKLTPQPSES